MRVGIYDPYLDTLGGGERYVLSIASYLANKHKVEVFWDEPSILNKASKKMNLDLQGIETVKNIFSGKSSIIDKFQSTKIYDVIFYVSDGSLPFLFAKKNILIFQFPVNWAKGALIDKVKLTRINEIICYSDFVKIHIDKIFKRDSRIIHPPVDQFKATNSEKKNVILTVGRFTKAMNAKKQEVLISAFKKMCDDGLKNWKLKVVGSFLPNDKDFVDEISKKAKGYPVEIVTNVSYSTLEKFYKEAKIYWHAAGFDEDLEKYPERAEHFGITTVEAMSAGAVPVVIYAGGQKEIVQNEVSGFLWSDLGQLQNYTKNLIENSNLRKKISEQSIKRSKEFSKEKFYKEIENIIS